VEKNRRHESIYLSCLDVRKVLGSHEKESLRARPTEVVALNERSVEHRSADDHTDDEHDDLDNADERREAQNSESWAKKVAKVRKGTAPDFEQRDVPSRNLPFVDHLGESSAPLRISRGATVAPGPLLRTTPRAGSIVSKASYSVDVGHF